LKLLLTLHAREIDHDIAYSQVWVTSSELDLIIHFFLKVKFLEIYLTLISYVARMNTEDHALHLTSLESTFTF
jgi:hypothetical protein